jgi:hypothetical protein
MYKLSLLQPVWVAKINITACNSVILSSPNPLCRLFGQFDYYNECNSI